MARYIDAEKLWNDRPPFPKDQSDDYVLGFKECMWAFSKLIREQINNAPTDVAPRAEVAMEIFEEIEKTLNRKIAHWQPHLEDLEKRESHLSIWGYKDMGYFKGIIVTCEDLQDLIDELKKKYTEGQK